MRDIINISLPSELTKVVEKAVRKRRYASKSEFFRDLLRKWIENELYCDVQESEKEFKAGKGKKLHSLRDLR